MAAQGLEEWLEAAGDKAADDQAVDADVADAGRALYLPCEGVPTKVTSTRWTGCSAIMLRSPGARGALPSVNTLNVY
jgi:hypothetical protein